MDYILSEKKQECIFCAAFKENKDRENYVLKRLGDCFIIMNTFPYNNGHLMIAPKKHTGDLHSIPDTILVQMMKLLQLAQHVLTKAISPDGFNIGMNIGTVAGAGIADHIHMHIVPRWQGDTNYMPVLGDTRVMPQHLDHTYDLLRPHFKTTESA
ncbi:MAG: HIT family protein [bacterium]